jgi:hypothetical protein
VADKYPYPESAARFARDTKHHKMTVLHDDGLYRHLRFQHEQWHPPLLQPIKRSCYWFDLVTIPGALIFQGDGDSYMFRRLEDMFEFFRQPGGAHINPGYWSEKLVGVGGQDQATSYQQDLLAEYVNETVADAAKDDPETLAGLTDAVRDSIIDELIGDESIDRQLVDSFRYWANDSDEWAYPPKRPDFEFVDTFDVTTRDYDWWFLCACNAIVWGIAQYDTYRASQLAATSELAEAVHSG